MRSPASFPLFLFLTFCALAIRGQAAVISTTGSVQLLPAPLIGTLPIAPNTLESDDVIRLYYISLPFGGGPVPGGSLDADICQPGTYTFWGSVPPCNLGGSYVLDLAYIYFDPIGNPDPPIIRSGSVTFSTGIVAILAGGSSGLELGGSSPDSLTFSADRRTVGFTLGEGYPVSLGNDQIVVFLNSDVPEPGTSSYIGCALVLLAVFVRGVSSKKASNNLTLARPMPECLSTRRC